MGSSNYYALVIVPMTYEKKTTCACPSALVADFHALTWGLEMPLPPLADILPHVEFALSPVEIARLIAYRLGNMPLMLFGSYL